MLEYSVSSGTPSYTVVMPVFNQELIISSVLRCLLNSASLPFDLYIINDASSDQSLLKIREFIGNIITSPKLTKVRTIKIFDNVAPLFETACDNIGFREANTEYIFELQADIKIYHYGFDWMMIAALEKYNFGTISGRMVHSFDLLPATDWKNYPLDKLLMKIGIVSTHEGLIGRNTFTPDSGGEGWIRNKPDYCYAGETCARGPLLFRKKDLELLNYLDEKNFFLGNDDHDFNRRLYQLDGRVAGYLPIKIKSDPRHGATRRPRSGLNANIFIENSLSKTGSTSFKNFLKAYKPYQPIVKLKF